MKAKVYLPILLLILFFGTDTFGQYGILNTAVTGTPATLVPQSGGNTPMSVAYNPGKKIYYLAQGGINSAPVNAFDSTGNFMVSAPPGADYRGIWWNINTSELEGNTYGGGGFGPTGIIQANTDANGLPLASYTTIFNTSNQPNPQSMGAYDYNTNQIIYYNSGTIRKVNRATNATVNTVTITGLPVGIGNLNSYGIAYTGFPGGEYGVLDYVNNRFYFLDTNGVYVATCQLPAGTCPSVYGMGFANDMLWLLNGGQWHSYYVYNGYFVKYCNIPEVHILSLSYAQNSVYLTSFGDGTSQITPAVQGTTVITHDYLTTGLYTVKNVLVTNGVNVDSVIFNYNYHLCNSISIGNYFDANGNCQMDIGEHYNFSPLKVEVDSNSVPVDTIIATSGIYYEEHGNVGDVYQYKILTLPPGIVLSCPQSGVITDTIQSSLYCHRIYQFGFVCSGNSYDFSINAIEPVTGIHDEWTHMFINNNTFLCFNPNAVVTASFSPKYSFTNNGYPMPTTVSGNVLTWDISGLVSVPREISYCVWNVNNNPLVAGDTVNSAFMITPVAGDADTSNNSTSTTDTVKNGQDPNEMWVIPQGVITAGTQLKYVIDFENTGNDTAFNIHIMDTLSDNVDVRTLKLIATSDAMNISKYNYNGHNILKFDFPDINLPDSTHHGQCDGFVSFYINAKPGLPIGTTIFNEVGIYFDYNDVVMTNTVEDIIGQPQKVQTLQNEGNVKLYPNPASDMLTVSMDKVQYSSLSITNSIGQEVLRQAISNSKTNIDISKLPTSVYYVTLSDSSGSIVKKFVKM